MSLGLDIILRYPLAPVLIWQGLRVRRTALVLPEAAGARSGEVGQGADLSVLILGDSSAAGVGVADQSDALSGQVIQRLAQHGRVRWALWAKTGVTTRTALAHVQAKETQTFDVALVALGVNDVTRGVSLRKWRYQSSALRALLRQKFGVSRIVVTAVPPMRHFPALPWLLRWILGAQVARFDAALMADLAREPDAEHLTLDLPVQPEFMARDGFHPSAETYALWGEIAAGMILASAPSAVSSESHRQGG